MAAHRPSHLQDRLLANGPDPIKTSILRESGLGWTSSTGSLSSSSSGSITSPLRIAKRESPAVKPGADVVRRSSSSFKHVKNNNLVSKSPFKTQPLLPPMPSRPVSVVFPTRRVSGEKRPRPPSMIEEAETENDRPFSLKRDRKQSKTFQGLLEKEPVTKSPFKQKDRVSSLDETLQPPPIPRIPRPSHPSPISPVAPHLTPINNDSPSRGPSPGRSSLVSRRLHGPRLSGSGQKERRKTVTFDERCDVVEFDRATFEDETFSTDDEERYGPPYHKDEDDCDPFFQNQPDVEEIITSEQHPQDVAMDDPYDGTQLTEVYQNSTNEHLLDPDTSITGLVEEMFFSSHPTSVNADSLVSSTPPRVSDIPTDLETEDGVPFGRTHHIQRLLQHRQQHSPQLNQSPPHFSPRQSPQISQPQSQHQSPGTSNASLPYPFNLGLPTYASPHGPPATPPRRPSMDRSTPPLGRSTHTERILKAREEEGEEAQMTGQEAARLPLSPSPVKQANVSSLPGEKLVPKLSWPEEPPIIRKFSHSPGTDPVEDGSGYIESIHEGSYEEPHTSSSESLDPANLSIGNSEVSLSNLDRSDIYRSDDEGPAESVLDNSSFLKDGSHQGEHSSIGNTSGDDDNVLAPFEENIRKRPSSRLSSGVQSPAVRTTSPLLAATRSRSQTSSPRPVRISKEDIQRRLTEKRNTVSPSPEPISCVTESIMTQIGASHSGEDIEMKEEKPEAMIEMEEHENERDGVSFMTAMTDIATEPATPECAEKLTLMEGVPADKERHSKELGLLEPSPNLQLNFGSKFSLGGFGLSRGDGSTRSKDSLGVLKESKRNSAASTSSMKVGDVDVQMDMKSALDRLMDDVAGAGGREEDSIMTEDYDDSFEQSDGLTRSRGLQRAAADTVTHEINEVPSRQTSGSSTLSLPPPLPPKDNNIKAREQLILEKRREARRMEEGNFVPTRGARQQDQRNLGLGRPSRRRSLSAGDVQEMGKRRMEGILGMEKLTEEDPLSDSIERELRKLVDTPATRKNKYYVREREETIYASSSEDKISHMAGPGDVDTGKAWRAVRRPSDMNEYSKQIKEYRNQANPAKAYGKVFVKVLGVKDVHLPLPQQPTALTCTLNNGIHFVTTPECTLGLDCRIDQEFELIEHSKLEFTLTLKVRRDPHIIAQFKELTPAPAPAPAPVPPPVQQQSSRGVRAFFSSSPKKPSKEKAPPRPQPRPQPVHRLPENLARYLKPDGTLARAFIQFKEIAVRCDTRLFETSYPLIGQRVELGGKFSSLQIGEIVLQMFRLPPLPGIPPDQLPQSLDECHRGLRHLNWHKMTYFQGTLTQSGGDCNTWRRRHFRVIGSNLVAFNDVTKKATATIDLKKALAVHDDQELKNPHSPSARSRKYDDDLLYGVERSFRLVFSQDQEIIFFADTDEEKTRWLEVFRALVGHIPPHPFWAELLWQRQEELSKQVSKAA